MKSHHGDRKVFRSQQPKPCLISYHCSPFPPCQTHTRYSDSIWRRLCQVGITAYAFTTSVSWRTLQLATTQLMWMMKTMTKCSPCSYDNMIPGKGKGTVCTLDIAPLRETPHQKRSGMARLCSQGISVLSAHSHVHLQSEWAMSCLCFPSNSWYSFTDPGVMEGWVGLGGWLRIETNTAKRLRFVYVIRRTPDLRQNWVEEIKTMSAKAPNGTAETSEQAVHDATVSTVVVKRLQQHGPRLQHINTHSALDHDVDYWIISLMSFEHAEITHISRKRPQWLRVSK